MTDNNECDKVNIEESKLNINGHDVHYRKAGVGSPVLLLHGGASDSRDWLGTMQALAGSYTLYAPDIIGFGRSDRREEGYYMSEFRGFVEKFIDVLQLGRVFLVGHSFGARLCLDVARNRPELVRNMVLIDAAGLGDISRFGSVLFTVFWGLRRLLRKSQPYPTFLAREGDDYTSLSEDELLGIKIPTLLVWKRFDPYMPVSIARRSAELIPDSRLVVIPGYGHAPHQMNTDTFNAVLRDFLDSH